MKLSFLVTALVLGLVSGYLPAASIDADDPLIQYFGRFDFTTPKAVRFDWPGILIEARFTGTSIGVRMADDNDRYDVTIDGQPFPMLVTKGMGEAVYPLASGLAAGDHTLVLARRHEQASEVPSFLGFVVDDGATLVPLPPKPDLKLEFLGDSFTVGYGVESPVREGGYPEYLKYTDTSKAYGPLVAAHYHAQYLISGYSGLGLVRNNGGANPDKTFTVYYPYTLHTLLNTGGSPTRWDFSKWQPRVVVVNLGINDFTGNQVAPADHETWKAAYHRFLADLRGWYPKAKFILCATPIWPGFEFEPLTNQVVADEKTAGHQDVWYFSYNPQSTALNWHPSVQDQRDIAQGLEALIDREHLLD